MLRRMKWPKPSLEEIKEPSAPFLARPEEILGDLTLSKDEKRAVLASWLSDARALPDAPRWRQLDNGAFVDVDDLYAALRVLDDFAVGVEDAPCPQSRLPGPSPGRLEYDVLLSSCDASFGDRPAGHGKAAVPRHWFVANRHLSKCTIYRFWGDLGPKLEPFCLRYGNFEELSQLASICSRSC